MAKQSKEDRLKRLSEGRCPIHGIYMPQDGLEYLRSPCGHIETGRYIVQCPRRDCEIMAFEEKPYEDAVLLPKFEHLVK